MGMPNAYKCEVCRPEMFFPGNPSGLQQLQSHYQTPGHTGHPVPTQKNAYQCHHTNCGQYASDACKIIEHYRTRH